MKYRTYLFIYVSIALVFVIMNYVIWKNVTETLQTRKYGAGGDLARLGYVLGSKQAREAVTDLTRRHLEYRDYHGQPIDVLTIGDSFSIGGGEGRNRYYQDYIATINGMTVLNLSMLDPDKGPLHTAIILLNSGFLDAVKPRMVLLQSVERHCIERFGTPVDFTATKTVEQIKKHYETDIDLYSYLPDICFLNDSNFKYLLYKIAYMFSDEPTGSVARKQLSRGLFSAELGSTLLFLTSDVKGITRQSSDSIGVLNANMNTFADILARRGVRLYFMPVVDKYDLYSDFIINNHYPKSRFFEVLGTLAKKYRYIDTKRILLDEVRKGEKDIFHADDTHWSWKASKKIFEHYRFSAHTHL